MHVIANGANVLFNGGARLATVAGGVVPIGTSCETVTVSFTHLDLDCTSAGGHKNMELLIALYVGAGPHQGYASLNIGSVGPFFARNQRPFHFLEGLFFAVDKSKLDSEEKVKEGDVAYFFRNEPFSAVLANKVRGCLMLVNLCVASWALGDERVSSRRVRCGMQALYEAGRGVKQYTDKAPSTAADTDTLTPESLLAYMQMMVFERFPTISSWRESPKIRTFISSLPVDDDALLGLTVHQLYRMFKQYAGALCAQASKVVLICTQAYGDYRYVQTLFANVT